MHTGIETAYLGIDGTDPAALARYLGDVVGLMPGPAAVGMDSSWRVDDRVRRLWVQKAERDDAACIGFEAVDAAAWERALSRLRAAGVGFAPFDAARKAARGVRDGVGMATPWGVPLELVLGLARAAEPFSSPHFPDGFVTQGQGFGHFVFAINDAAEYDASRRFATEALGLALTDWLRMPIPGGEMHVSFFHGNARHHSLALAFVPVPQLPRRLHHVNFEVARLDVVGAALDRAVRSATPLASTLGQHDNDAMVSFYSVSPGGWQVEIGATGRTVAEPWSDQREYHRISAWGHHPPAALAALQPPQ